MILLEKTFQVPMRAMDIKPSTPAENVDALEHIFQQSGVGDPNEHPTVTSLGDHVALICGDLLTVQHIQSLALWKPHHGAAFNLSSLSWVSFI